MTQADQGASNAHFRFIPLGVTVRPQAGDGRPPSEVRSVSDLPTRLFLGDLDRSSFRQERSRLFGSSTWSARYVGSTPDTYVNVSGGPKGFEKLTLVWRGVEGYSLRNVGHEWGRLAQHLSLPPFPQAWDGLARSYSQSRYNIQYFASSSEETRIWSVPDGPGKVILCPMPINRALDALRCIQDIQHDSRIAAGVFGYSAVNQSAVNYIEGRCPGVPSDPVELFHFTLEQTGLPPPLMPIWEQAADGSRALTVRRLHYTFVVHCFFRDEERVIEQLHAHGLIGDVHDGPWPERYPESPEFSALVLHDSPEGLGGQVQFADRLGSRQLTYWQMVLLDDLPRIMAAVGRSSEAPALIVEAQAMSQAIRDQIAGNLRDVERK